MKTYRKWLLALIAGVIVLSMVLLTWHLTHAAMLYVSSLADTTANDGYCTLREALINANDDAATWPDCAAGNGADTIYLTNLSGQLLLLSDLPSITDTDGLTLQGPGAAQLTLSGGGLYRIFNVENGAPLTVRHITLARASSTSTGSAIRAANGSAIEVWSSAILTSTNSAINIEGGSLKAIDSVFQGNTTTGAGGGIRAVANPAVTPSAPTVLVDVSTFTVNSAGGGHALHQASGVLTLNNSRFERNGTTTAEGFGTVEYRDAIAISITGCDFLDNQTWQGGALNDAGGNGVVHIENSSFIGNVAGYGAGVIRSGGGRSLDIRHSVFTANAAAESGGVINSYAAMTITASTFSSNTANMGGVIYTHNDASGPVVIEDSLFDHNQATWGGAVWYGRGLYITNTTFYSNTAIYGGGALASLEGWGEVNNSTFDHNGANNGAALYFGMDRELLMLRNTILANPTRGNNCYAYAGFYRDGGYNLQYPGVSCNPAIPEVDPQLDPAGPQDNGGPTWTIALQAGSPAIDRAPVGGGFYCPATDQRGAARPVDGDGVGAADCDSGAFEYSSVAPDPTPTLEPTATPAPTATPTPIPVLTFSKTAEDVNGAPLLPGDTIRYTLQVTNSFTYSATGVTLSDSVPTYTTYVPASAIPAADADSDPLVWSDRDIQPGTWTFTFEVTVNAHTGGRVIQNVACLTQPDVPEHCTPPVTPPGENGGVVQPQLQMHKTALDVNGAPLLPGDVIRYTVVVTNPHTVDVNNVVISDTLPTHTAYVIGSATPAADVDSNPLVWSSQNFTAGASRTYQFDARVDATAGGQTIANAACLVQPHIPQMCTAPVTPPGEGGGTVLPVLLFGKTARDVNGGSLVEGDVIRYTLMVTNPHSVAVSGVVISDVIPAHTTYVADSDAPEADADSDPLVWSGQVFDPGSLQPVVKTYTFEVTVDAGALGQFIHNSACLTQPDRPQTCTAPIAPPGGGQVKTLVYLPLVLNTYPAIP
ncbi:MAG: DUF11 domain-containing protein [Anaerolineae bacterium]|nr:DUF11 domain-containing protein [Anaerolineae bacterium]